MSARNITGHAKVSPRPPLHFKVLPLRAIALALDEDLASKRRERGRVAAKNCGPSSRHYGLGRKKPPALHLLLVSPTEFECMREENSNLGL